MTLVDCGLQPGDATGRAAASGSCDSGQCPSAPRPHPLLGDRDCSSGRKLQGRWLRQSPLKARSQAVSLPFFLWGLHCCQHLPLCSAPSESPRLRGDESPPPTWSHACSGRNSRPGRTCPWQEPQSRPRLHSGLQQPVPLSGAAHPTTSPFGPSAHPGSFLPTGHLTGRCPLRSVQSGWPVLTSGLGGCRWVGR